ncbi:MAG: CPBP family intramembrane glutamic endopeptidase [Eubacteriales bacterium]|jgi:membrane protease YdiL (CAAX protease family)
MEQVMACTRWTVQWLRKLQNFLQAQWDRSASSCLLLLSLAMLCVSSLLQPVFTRLGVDATEQVIFIQCISFLLPAGLYFWLERDREAFRFRTVPLTEIPLVILASVALSIVCLLLSSLLLLLTGGGKGLSSAGILGNSMQLGLFAGAILPAFCEEFLLRGAVLRKQESMGRFCILLSGVGFAMLHGSLDNWIGPCLAGCVYAGLTLRYQSVLPAMVSHFVNNAYLFLMGHLADRYAGMDAILLLYIINVVLLFSCIYGIIIYYEKHRESIRFFQPLSLPVTDRMEVRRAVTSLPFILFCVLWVGRVILAL